MPNIASVIKDEILRIARKQTRKEIEGLKKASAQHRSGVADLKRRVADLEKQQTRIVKKSGGKRVSPSEDAETKHLRFSARRLAVHRAKLGLSAAEMGILVGVSAQTIYNWESERSRPRQQQLVAIASLRRLGKREIKAKLSGTAE